MGMAMTRQAVRATRPAAADLVRPAGDVLHLDRKRVEEGEQPAEVQREAAPSAAPPKGHSFGALAVVAPAAPQTTVEVSEPDDPAEQEADQVAERVMGMLASGTPGDAPIPLAATGPALQRAPDEAGAQPQPASGGFLVDDESTPALPGQMRKSEFLAALRPAVCAAADQELARAGRNSEGCPYLDRWFGHYQEQDAQHVERALRKYAPETVSATSARDYISPVSARVAQGVRRWVDTGDVPELPEGITPDMLAGGGVMGALATVGSAVTSAVSAVGSFFSSLFFKAKPGGAAQGVDAGALGARLGGGQPLDAAARSRMGSAFGYDFGAVRIHDDAPSAALAQGLNARAFTLGSHIAFGADEYRPGTPVGDALLAHELAHVIQQRQATSVRGLEASTSAIEDDADSATVEVMHSLWEGGERKAQPRRGAGGPRLRSGLSLSRCAHQQAPPAQVPTTAPAAPAQQPAPPQRSRLDECGVWVPGMSAQDRELNSNCRRHEGFVEAMQRSVASMRTVASPYAPGLAALYGALMDQVVAAAVTDPPATGSPRIFTVSNVTVRVSASTSIVVPTFKLKLAALGSSSENGSFGSHPDPELLLNEESDSATRYIYDQGRDAGQVDIERTMYHEGVHFLSSIVTQQNRAAPAGTPPVEAGLDASFLIARHPQFRTAVLPYWTRALQEPTAVDPATGAPPTAARIPRLADAWEGLVWEKVASEILTRLEERIYLDARGGRTFTAADVGTFQQPWLETAAYWGSLSLREPDMQAFLTRNAAGIRQDVLPVVQQIQRDFLALRPTR